MPSEITVIEVDVSTAPTIAEILVPGEQGPPGPMGPDPWDEPIQIFANVSGSLTIDYALGKYAELTLVGNTSISVVHWPQTERNARLTLEIVNSGSLAITGWPAGTVWQFGAAPSLTANGRDVIVLTTVNGGARIYGHVVGQDYR